MNKLLDQLVTEMVSRGVHYTDAQREFDKRFITCVIEKSDGEKVFLKVEVADTPVSITVGLMFRTEMPEDHGMLFWFGPPAVQRDFWMKNTLIPLDMLFLDEAGKIVFIERNATPQDLTPRGPDAPVVAVLEINGGIAEKRGIAVGDKVLHGFFGSD